MEIYLTKVAIAGFFDELEKISVEGIKDRSSVDKIVANNPISPSMTRAPTPPPQMEQPWAGEIGKVRASKPFPAAERIEHPLQSVASKINPPRVT
jgi:hypothetical protein